MSGAILTFVRRRNIYCCTLATAGKIMTCLFSIDVEDWFHILDISQAPGVSAWNNLPSRIEDNFLKILDLLQIKEVRATCFFLGWVATKYPHLVKEAHRRGHEVASHGYQHKLVYEMSPDRLLEDITRAKNVLEDLIGVQVDGFRAPGFSVTMETPWFFEIIHQAGYKYDSSVFPARRGHGGQPGYNPKPHLIKATRDDLIELPVTVMTWLGCRVSFFGGGYLRFFPYSIIKRKALQIMGESQPVIWYIHPREIDPYHPRLPMNPVRSFKSYFNLKSTLPKLSRILEEFEWLTFSDYIERNRKFFERHDR